MTSDPQPQDDQAPAPSDPVSEVDSASEVDSVAEQPVAADSVAADSVAADSVAADSVAADSVAASDRQEESEAGQPESEEAGDAAGSTAEATAVDDASASSAVETTSSVEEPSIEEPSVEEPSVEEPSVEEPSVEEPAEEDENVKQWYILKVQVNREESIRRALERRIKVAGLDEFVGDIVVPTEDVAEFNKNGKRRIVKKKLYPGYIMINLVLNDDTWFLVRETPGIGDFTGSAGKPTPMEAHEVARIIKASAGDALGEAPVKTAIPFKPGDRVRVKEGYFENFEGDVETIDEANGRITVMINIFGRSTPVELEHWQVESV